MKAPVLLVIVGALFVASAAPPATNPQETGTEKLGKYLGRGYIIFKGNPFNPTADPGIFKPFLQVPSGNQCNNTEYATCSFDQEHMNRDWLLWNVTGKHFNRPAIDMTTIENTPCDVFDAFGINVSALTQSRIHLYRGALISVKLQMNTTLQTSLNLRSAKLKLHPQFLNRVCNMSSENRRAEAVALLESFGTHVITGVALRTFTLHRHYYRSPLIEERLNGTDQVFVTRLVPMHDVLRVLLLEHSASEELTFCMDQTNYTGAPARRVEQLLSWLQDGLIDYTEHAWNASWSRHGVSRQQEARRLGAGGQWCSAGKRQSTNHLGIAGALLYWLVSLSVQ